jgi:SAM-dependent methyltransferase
MAAVCDRLFDVEGVEVELGTGAGFFRSVRPGLMTSDVREGVGIDRKLDAMDMDLAPDSVRCIYAINVFHHLPDPERFFEELGRVLRVGGGCILIEPHGGIASSALHAHLHSDEHFDTAASWTNESIGGPLSGANQALAHIVFSRDRAEFERKFGVSLQIVHQQYELNGLRYLLSGGLNFRQLAPTVLVSLLQGLERVAGPLARYWSLHQMIALKRVA